MKKQHLFVLIIVTCMSFVGCDNGIDQCPNSGNYSNSLGMVFVCISPGEFTMGTSQEQFREILELFGQGDECASEDYHRRTYELELPAHRVKITKPFYIAATEVTVGQFRSFVEATGYKTQAEKGEATTYTWDSNISSWVIREDLSWKNPGWPLQEIDPGVMVTWHDARAFAEWLSKMDNRHYRLPTEAEWELAARGGLEDRLYPWGNDLPDGTRMNFADATWDGPYSLYLVNDGYKFVAPVGSYPPNSLGLYDMAGNVWEWVADYQQKYPHGLRINPTNVKRVTEDSRVLMRGGCFMSRSGYCRVASRMGHRPSEATLDIGFRLVMEIQEGE